jgi:putative transposase
MQTKQQYPTDLTDSRWNLIKEMLPAPKPGGRPCSLELRQIINAILYLVVGGMQWQMMPKEYPKWKSVYHYFPGLWQRIHDTLRARMRQNAGRPKHPTAGCLDSQSVETTLLAGVRGFDAGKHVMSRKHHILVDTLGLLLGV